MTKWTVLGSLKAKYWATSKKTVHMLQNGTETPQYVDMTFVWLRDSIFLVFGSRRKLKNIRRYTESVPNFGFNINNFSIKKRRNQVRNSKLKHTNSE